MSGELEKLNGTRTRVLTESRAWRATALLVQPLGTWTTQALCALANQPNFTYSGGRLQSTQLPEVPGTTTYAYNADGTLLSKTDYKGVRKYYYTTAKQLERVERYPGAVGQPEDLKGRVENFYNVIPAAAGTSFVGQNLQGRLAATKYNCNSLGLSCMWEFYSYTKGGRLLKKGLPAQAMTMEVRFEYDRTRGSLRSWCIRAASG